MFKENYSKMSDDYRWSFWVGVGLIMFLVGGFMLMLGWTLIGGFLAAYIIGSIFMLAILGGVLIIVRETYRTLLSKPPIFGGKEIK